MAVHKITGITPNMAMLGREVLLPTTLIASPLDEPINVTVPFVQDFRDTVRAAHDRVRQATQSAAKVQKTYFDRQVKGPPFAVEQRVWLYWPRPPLRQQHRKLQRLWTGPWRIRSFKSQVVVVIQHEKSNKRQTVHIDRLAPCLSPDSHATTTSNTTACSTRSVRIDQPNGQRPTRSPARTNADTSDPLASANQTSYLDVPSSAIHGRPRRPRKRPTALESYSCDW